MAGVLNFRERRRSLEFREIRPSEFVGTRRKVALRIEAYSWAPDLRSFDKIRKVGDLSYLGFTPCLNTLLMLELNEAEMGRLIGPKAWDRIVKN